MKFIYGILSLIGIGVVIKLVQIFLSQPFKHKNIDRNRLREFVNNLYRRGYDKGFIVFANKNKDIVQFMKHISADGIELRSGWMRCKGNERYFDDIRQYLNDNNYNFELWKEDGHEGLDVALNENLDSCVELITGINEKVYKIDPEEMIFTVWFKNISPDDKFIKTK